MRLSNFTLGLRFELKAGSESDNCDAGMGLRDRFHRRGRHDWSVDGGSSFTARMLRRSHLAVARHLLAAVHLRLRHLVGREAGEHGHGRPQSQQS
jgi:hypothetical protein